MIGEKKYMPLSNAVLPAALRWVSYGLVAVLVIAALISIRHFPEFQESVRTGKIDFVRLLTENWAWPILLLNIVFGEKHYPIKYVCAIGYLAVILSLEISIGSLNLKLGLDIGLAHWVQIILFLALLLLMPVFILKPRKAR